MLVYEVGLQHGMKCNNEIQFGYFILFYLKAMDIIVIRTSAQLCLNTPVLIIFKQFEKMNEIFF